MSKKFLILCNIFWFNIKVMIFKRNRCNGMISNGSILPFPHVCSIRKTPTFGKSVKIIFIYIRVTFKYQRITLWQWPHTRNGMLFENGHQLELRRMHKQSSLFLSLKVETYCFVWGFCLDKVSVFFIITLLSLKLFLQCCSLIVQKLKFVLSLWRTVSCWY